MSPPPATLFVFQHTAKRPPALIQNRLVQSRLFARRGALACSPCPVADRDIMLHLQIFKDNDRVVFAGLCRELVQEIVAAIGNADIEPGDPALLLLPVLGVLHHARQTPLHAGFLLLDTAIGIERRIQRASRGGGKGGNPQVNAHSAVAGCTGSGSPSRPGRRQTSAALAWRR